MSSILAMYTMEPELNTKMVAGRSDQPFTRDLHKHLSLRPVSSSNSLRSEAGDNFQ